MPARNWPAWSSCLRGSAEAARLAGLDAYSPLAETEARRADFRIAGAAGGQVLERRNGLFRSSGWRKSLWPGLFGYFCGGSASAGCFARTCRWDVTEHTAFWSLRDRLRTVLGPV